MVQRGGWRYLYFSTKEKRLRRMFAINASFKGERLNYNAQIKKLIKTLPLWAKAAQHTQLNAASVKKDSQAEITGLAGNSVLVTKEIREIGSVLNFFGAKEQKEIQEIYPSKSQYKIPLIFMMDVIRVQSIPFHLRSAVLSTSN